MEKFNQDAEYNEVVKAAKQLNIDYVGVKKPIIIEKINAKLDKIAAGEVQAPETQTQPTSEVVENEVTETGSEQTKRRGRKPSDTPRQPRVKKAKWFEEEGVELPYKAGDIVEVTGGDILIGRKAEVVKMSAKKDALKAILIHPVKGTLQGCLITLDFWKIKMAEDQTPPKGADEEATDELIKDNGVQAVSEEEESKAV